MDAADPVTGTVPIRDRVIRVVRVPADSIKVNPRNWRKHPDGQAQAMEAILARIGFIGAVVVRELVPGDDTQLELIDGHLRKHLMSGGDVTAIVTDLTEAEGLEALATFDQVSSLAVPDQDKLKSLFADLKALDVPLVDLGWPQYKLDAVLAEPWQAPQGTTDVQTIYQGMPEFVQEDQTGKRKITVHFDTDEAVAEFARRLEHPLTDKTRSIWFPRKENIDGLSYSAGADGPAADGPAEGSGDGD